jgi:glucose/arabinose dehydrogenase
MSWNLLSPRRGRKPSRPAPWRPVLETLEDRRVPANLPSGFTESLVTDGLSRPTTMEFAPDGRLFVAEQGGDLRVIKNGSLLPAPFVSLSVDSSGERGLLGIAFDPNFAANHYVYLYYTTASSPTHNRVSRFTADGDVAAAGSEVPILDVEPLGPTNHNGGAIHFGPDGKLYVAVGNNAINANSQSLDNRLGKVLRINADGSIPTDNPFYNQASGLNRAIYALGLRNPFTFAFQPGTGRMFINDVGENTWEEVDEGVAGANYGWPIYEGFSSPTDLNYRDPLYVYGHAGLSGSVAIVGAAFYDPATPEFPPGYLGKYFFGDLDNHFIRMLDPATLATTDFATDSAGGTLDNFVDVAVSPDGPLYYLAQGDGGDTGHVYAVRYTTTGHAPTLAPIADRAVAPSQATVTVPLVATDPDGDPITYTAQAESLAYVVNQRLNLYTSGNLFFNYYGAQEKWLLGAGSGWYFLLPTGDLYRWDGSGAASGTFIANTGASTWADPSLLYNAPQGQPHATLSVSGSTLTVTRDTGSTGGLVVTVTAGDGTLSDRKTFAITVTNRPSLAALADRAVPASQQVITVPLSATDPGGAALSYTVQADSMAYFLKQQLGLASYDSRWDNFEGAGEKWLLDGAGQWYFILPNGDLYRWDGGSGATGTLAGRPGASYWSDPNLLVSAAANQPHASFNVSGSTLTVTRDAGFNGSMVITVTAGDGTLSDSKTFTIFVG